MSETIAKLQPDRTIHLRGFTDLGAAAALHSATPTSFKVSGVFRDQADFAVLVIWDADNFFEHARIKYLPDFDFAGLVLTFDVTYSDGLQPLDSTKFPTISWPYLEAIREDGTAAPPVRLHDHATQVGGAYTPAAATLSVVDAGMQAGDRVTLWYQNFAFPYQVAGTGGTPGDVAASLASTINAFNWGVAAPLTASAQGEQLTITAACPGYDGNLITLYSTSSSSRLTLSPAAAPLSGGSSAATWRVTLDFSALGLDHVRQMWFTYAPRLPRGTALAPVEWEATYTNWTVTGPSEKRTLQVAGPGSVRVEEFDDGCSYSGDWSIETKTGFYSGGVARKATSLGSTARIRYSCQFVHDLYLGTVVSSTGGRIAVGLDGGPETDHSVYLPDPTGGSAPPAPIVTRRKLRSAVPPGRHEVTISLTLGPSFTFDFLEAVVPSAVPDPLPTRPNLSAALDYDTDHTYKLPPARVLWNLDQLGLTGPINEYLGVFWWNQRVRDGGTMPHATVTFGGIFAPGDAVFLKIGDLTIGKTVFAEDTLDIIAKHFEYFINSTYVGVWSAAEGHVLAITSHSAAPAYRVTLSSSIEPANSAGIVQIAGDLSTGELSKWRIDPALTPVLNRAVRDWHADLFAGCKARDRSIVVSCSMELVFPPAGFAAMFPGGEEVRTDVGFGSLYSTHCHFGPLMLAYQQQAYREIAGLQAAAQLTPELQCGEFLWWFFTNYDAAAKPGGGMAFYDGDTTAAAQAALGRPLAIFRSPDDDPSINGGADAAFLAGRLRDHVASLITSVREAYPNARFEVLYPYDVNYPQPAVNSIAKPPYSLGGRLNNAINFPPEWRRKETAGFDRIKIEALAFSAQFRNLNLAREAIALPLNLGWPSDSIRYLAPVFTPAMPWQKEVEAAFGQGVPVVNLWAFDHVSLFGLDVRAEQTKGRSFYAG